VAAAAAACALAFAAAPASAGTIVWDKGDEIWAMLDDGSYSAPIASAYELGMSSLGDPHVAPDGDVVVFDGNTNQFSHTTNGTFHCGFGCAGVYRWQNGQSVRLSAPPNNGDGAVSTFDHEPEVGANGRFVYTFFGCAGYVGVYGTYDCTTGVWSENIDGTDARDYGGACDDGPSSPSPNPANAAEVAYVGCDDANYDYGLWVSGENNANTRLIGAAAVPIEHPSWRSDGQQIVNVERGGSEPGLWIVQAAGAPGFRHVLADPAGNDFSSPRFMGPAQDRVIFGAAGELWTIPASCTAATCSFPASATQVTTGGDNSAPAWTARNLIAAPVQGGGGQTGGGSGQNGDGDTTGEGPSPVAVTLSRTRLRKALARGITFTADVGEAGRVSAVLRQKKKKVGAGSARVGADGIARARVRFTRKAARKLRRRKSARLTLSVTFQPSAGGAVRRGTTKLTLKR
jgi:hypothetical protein